jgi:1-deoxy-D-xylulose-5-phosphate reductoisomerase
MMRRIAATWAATAALLGGEASAFVGPSPRQRASTTTTAIGAAAATPPGSKGTGEGWIDPSAPVNSEASLKKTLEKSLEGSNFKKRLSILGSTGSIGTQTLQIVDACPDNFVVDALSAGTNAGLMAEQVLKYRPRVASLSTPEAAEELRRLLADAGCDDMPEIVHGDDGIVAAATVPSADTVVTGIVGAAGLQPTIEAIKLKKDIALANKETLISGGPVINPLVEKHGINMVRPASIRPCCSESPRTAFLLPYYTLHPRNSSPLTASTRQSSSACRASRRGVCAGSS